MAKKKGVSFCWDKIKDFGVLVLSFFYDGVCRILRRKKRWAATEKEMSALPQSNGTGYYKKLPVKVGIVCDELLFSSLAPTCDLFYITPDVNEGDLLSCDAFLVATAWRGRFNDWKDCGEDGSEKNRVLKSLMQKFLAAGKPVVFYSKEDPPNFDYFFNLAGYADYIFTSAKECVEKYRVAFPEVPVNVLLFGVNPLLYNPVGVDLDARRKKAALYGKRKALFAGSYMKKYPRRVKFQKSLFDGLKKSGVSLSVFDRNAGRKNIRYAFPLKYQRDVFAGISHEELAKAHKLHDYVINFNSVQESDTMFAMRVYDALATGNIILSNKSAGMQKLFPEVFVCEGEDGKADGKAIISALNLSREEEREIIKSGLRAVMRGNTSFDRMRRILSAVGLCGRDEKFCVGALISAEDGEKKERLKKIFDGQTYEDKKCFTSAEELLKDETVKAFVVIEENLPREFISDAVDCLKYVNVDFVTFYGADCKTGGAVGTENAFTEKIADKYATLYLRKSFSVKDVDDLCGGEITVSGKKGYVGFKLKDGEGYAET